MVTTRLYLDCRYTPKGSPALLKICIYKDNVRALIPMNINIEPDEWSAKRQRPRDDKLYSMIKTRLGKIEAFLFKQDTEGAFKKKWTKVFRDFHRLRSCLVTKCQLTFKNWKEK